MGLVILLRDARELDVIRAHMEVPGDAQVYTIFAHDWFEVGRKGVDARVLSELIETREVEPIYERAFRDAATVSNAATTANGVKLGRCFKVHYWEFLAELYMLDRAIQRAVDGGKMEIVSATAPVWFPSAHTQITDAAAMLGVIVEQYPGRRVGPVHPVGTRPSTIRRLGRLFLESLRTLRSDRAGRSPVHSGPHCVGYGNGYDALAVLPDVLVLSRRHELAPLVIGSGLDRSTTRTGVTWRHEFESVPVQDPPTAPTTLASSRDGNKGFAAVMNALNEIPEIRRYGFSALLRELAAEYQSVAALGGAVDALLQRHAGSDFVLTNFNGYHERLIEQLARRHGVRIHARPHGWMNSLEAYELDADRYYCNGPLNAEFVQRYYRYGSRIELNPDPSLVAVANEWLNQSDEARRAERDRCREALAPGATRLALLLTTASRGRRALNEFDRDAWKRTWSALLDLAQTVPDVAFVVKSHKNNFDAEVERLARERGVANVIVVSGRLEGVLRAADLAVDLGKPGTATLSALLFRTPLLLYSGMYRYVRPFGDAVHAVGLDFRADSAADLVSRMEELLRGGEAALAGVVERNAVLLERLAVSRRVVPTAATSPT